VLAGVESLVHEGLMELWEVRGVVLGIGI